MGAPMGCAVTFHDRIGRERLAAAVEPLEPEASLALLESALGEATRAAIGALDCEVEVSFVADAEMSRLHFDHMGERGPTDVLSFPLHEWVVDGESRLTEDDGVSPPGPLLLGDVVIDVDQAVRQAAAAGASVVEEIVLLAIHGTLHLVGHDHAEPEEEEAMRGIERQVLLTLRRRHREIEWHPGSLFDRAGHALGSGS
jgi:probable rRNA maturation factor